MTYTTIINELFGLDNHTEYDSLDTCIDDAVLKSRSVLYCSTCRGLDDQPKKLRKVEDYRPIACYPNSSEVERTTEKSP
jgi:hypothetical protein